MKKFGTKQITPILLGLLAAVFAVIGFTQLGFWDPIDGPKPGFFPGIMATVMLAVCVIAFLQSLKEENTQKYTRDELLIIASGIGIFAGAFIIGLLPALAIFILLWMKVLEKAPWKDTLIVLGISMAIAVGVFQMWLGIRFPMGLLENFM